MCFFFFKQKTEYELRISYWSSDVCSSDLTGSEELSGVSLVPLRISALCVYRPFAYIGPLRISAFVYRPRNSGRLQSDTSARNFQKEDFGMLDRKSVV